MGSAHVRDSARREARRRLKDGTLTRSQLRELDAELRRERARLERSLVGQARPDGKPDGAPGGALHHGGIGVQAPANAEEGLAVALESRTHARHAAIVDALARLELGLYGRCATCQERIPYGRLAVMPEAMHCIACSPGV